MQLAEELQAQVRAFIEQTSSLAELRRWMQDHEDDLDEIEDSASIDLVERAWALFAEWDLGDRTETDVRCELALLIPSSVVTVPHTLVAGSTSGSGRVVPVTPNFRPRLLRFGAPHAPSTPA